MMMRRMIGVCVAALCCLNVAPTWAEAPSRESTIKDVLKLSGMEHTLRQIPHQVVAGFDQQGQKLPAAQHAALRRALGNSFDAPMMERSVVKELSANLRPEVIVHTMEWLRSDLGRKITKLEEASSDPKVTQDMQAFAKELHTHPSSQERVQLIRRIDMATNSTELLLDITESLTVSLASAQDATLPIHRQIGPDRIRIQVSRERSSWRPQAQNHVLTTMLYTYRSLSQPELERYVAFLETESGLEFYSQSGAALKGAMDLGIQRATSAVMDVLTTSIGRKAI